MKNRLNIFTKVILSALMILAFSSCKEKRADLSGLLSTVPSSASGVIGIHLDSMLKDAGCKINGNEVEPGKELKAKMASMRNSDINDILKLFDGSTGIMPECAVIFNASNRNYLTFSLYDVNKFCEFIEKDKGAAFVNEENGVKICDNIAVKGAQAWICLTPYKKINADDINFYATLSESQSFLNSNLSKKILEEDEDIVGWSKLSSLLDGLLSRSQTTMFNLATGFLFEDATAVSFSIDFEEGELEAKALILNDKGKAAKYLLPAEKIDVTTLGSLGDNCDGMFAMTVTPKLIQKIEAIGSSIGGSLFSNLSETFKNVDGTVGAIISANGNVNDVAVNGFITLKGDPSQNLKDMISTFLAPVTVEGRFMHFTKGVTGGNLSVKECTKMIEGSCIGFVADMQSLNATGTKTMPEEYKCFALSFSPESGGLEMKFELKGMNPKENILLTFLK